MLMGFYKSKLWFNGILIGFYQPKIVIAWDFNEILPAKIVI